MSESKNKLQQAFQDETGHDYGFSVSIPGAETLSKKTGLKIYIFNLTRDSILTCMDYVDLTQYSGMNMLKLTDCYHSTDGFKDEIVVCVQNINSYYQI